MNDKKKPALTVGIIFKKRDPLPGRKTDRELRPAYQTVAEFIESDYT